MRISPTKLLHGLLYTAPILLLTLAACGGGGGSTPPGGSVTTTYTIGGTVTGLTGGTLVLRNNGGDDKTLTANGSYTFSTSIASGGNYNVTVLTQPTSVPLRCTVTTNPSGGSLSANVTNANVSCAPAYIISGTISGLSGTSTGLVLQNNGGDNYLVPPGAAGTFAFSTPLDTGTYNVTVLSHPHNPNQTCTPTFNTGTVPTGAANVTITCGTYVPPPQADRYVYAANNGSAKVSTYTSSLGVLSVDVQKDAGSGPHSVAVDPAGKHLYVVNYNNDNVSAYSISAGVLTPLTPATIAAGNGPRQVKIHPSGKFAYVVNYLDNSVSVYSIDATTGALARIDSDGATTANEVSIPAKVGPVSIAIHPAGGYAYVANADGNISTYSINTTTGALTAIPASGVPGTAVYISSGGTTPSSATIDPNGLHLYATNAGSANISCFDIISDGSLLLVGSPISSGTNPQSIAIHPGGGYAYVASHDSNFVWVYSIASGVLTNTSTVAAGTQPISVSIDSTGQYVYVANSGSGDISVYDTITSTGVLTQVSCGGGGGCSGSNFLSGIKPYGIVTAP